MKFSYKFNNLELRSCDEHLMSSGQHNTAEISEWFNSESCYVIAYFENTSEGYNLRFVGDRPLGESVNWKEFGKLIKIGYRKLGEYYV